LWQPAGGAGRPSRRAAIGALNPRDWPDAIVTVRARVERHQPGFGRRPYRVLLSDGTGS